MTQPQSGCKKLASSQVLLIRSPNRSNLGYEYFPKIENDVVFGEKVVSAVLSDGWYSWVGWTWEGKGFSKKVV